MRRKVTVTRAGIERDLESVAPAGAEQEVESEPTKKGIEIVRRMLRVDRVAEEAAIPKVTHVSGASMRFSHTAFTAPPLVLPYDPNANAVRNYRHWRNLAAAARMLVADNAEWGDIRIAGKLYALAFHYATLAELVHTALRARGVAFVGYR